VKLFGILHYVQDDDNYKDNNNSNSNYKSNGNDNGKYSGSSLRSNDGNHKDNKNSNYKCNDNDSNKNTGVLRCAQNDKQ
jgi:hypothetical protein